jgi:hypothetical protein
MSRSLLTTAFLATAAILGNRIVKYGANDGEAVQATANNEAFAGISDRVGADVGDTIDVKQAGFSPVEYGGAVTRGAYLTSDAQGRAIAAAPGAGANMDVVGRATVSGVLGDIGGVVIGFTRIQG